MAFTTQIGSNLETAAPPMVMIAAPMTTTVKHVSGPTLSHVDLHGQAAKYTTSATQSQTYAVTDNVVYLKPSGLTTITLTGGPYGS